MTEQELSEKITKVFSHYSYAFEVEGWYNEKPYVEEVITLIKEAGWVELSDDQTLPRSFWDVVRDYPGEISNELAAIGWRRIKLGIEREQQLKWLESHTAGL